MKQLTALSFILLLNKVCCGQDNLHFITDSIEQEGKALYRSERASWLATDIFLDRFKQQEQNLGGYFSYAAGDNTKSIFFARGEDHQVLCTVTFSTGFKTSDIDSNKRVFNKFETEIFTVRQKNLQVYTTDTFFKRYNNTDLNVVPMIKEDDKKVYILTGPKANGIVLFGNDYLLTFNNHNEIISKQRLHSSLIPIRANNGTDTLAAASIHTHLPEFSSFITATDICTLIVNRQLKVYQ